MKGKAPKNICIPVSADTHKKMKTYAAQQGKTMKAVIVSWIENAANERSNQCERRLDTKA